VQNVTLNVSNWEKISRRSSSMQEWLRFPMKILLVIYVERFRDVVLAVEEPGRCCV